MNFSELVAEVISKTKRPDLQAQTESAVRAATLKAHQKEFYYKDIREEGVEFTTPAMIQSFQPDTLFPRYRAPAYVRKWNQEDWDPDGHPGDYLDKSTIGNLKNYFGFDKTNIYYQAGNRLNMRSDSDIRRILFGFYAYPNLIAEEFDSWIAREYPWAIIYDATRQIFSDISYLEQANKFEGLAAEQFAILTINNSTADFP